MPSTQEGENKGSHAARLNARQNRFVQEYLVDLNATQAAIRAGYELAPCAPDGGFYVYALLNGGSGEIFYIGKGTGSRFDCHEREVASGKAENVAKASAIRAAQESGGVQKVFLARGLSEAEAFELESEFILAVGTERLTNLAPGQRSANQRVIDWAQDALGRIKPREQWARSVGATREMLILYDRVVHEIRETAAGNRPVEVEVRHGTPT